ncbi:MULTISPECIES: hypothetical protein [unclassified Mesorhizobium]|nr:MULTISPECIES: hypothetical protein [unclassified Mesorhizobium]
MQSRPTLGAHVASSDIDVAAVEELEKVWNIVECFVGKAKA